jgi:hypothetical protein
MFYGRGDFSEVPVAYEWLTRGGHGSFQSPFGKLMVFDRKTLWGTTNHKNAFTYNLYSYDISNIGGEVKKDFPKLKDGTKPTTLIGELEIHPRALIKAGDNIIIAGFTVADSLGLQYGRAIGGKGKLLHVSSADGKILSKSELASPPIFDGMAAADGVLYVSCEDNSVVCFK